MPVAARRDAGVDHGPDGGQHILVGQRWWVFVKDGVGFERELVDRQMRRRPLQRLIDIALGIGQRLTGQADHQIKIEVVEHASSGLDSTARLRAIVHAAQRGKLGIVEGLDADRQTIDAGRAIRGVTPRLIRAGIGLQRDLAVGRQRQAGTHGGQQPFDPRARQQAGGAAANENAVNVAPPDRRQRGFQVGLQRRQIGFLGNVPGVVDGVGIEVAIGTLAHAPGDMDVQR